MPIIIPETLANKLKANSALYGAVLQSFAEFEPWFTSSGTPFFPEYTDHGPLHITETIDTASSLVRDEAWPVVTPTDAGALVLAILLHDSAMHLSEDGFMSLVGPKPANRQLNAWAEMPWPDLWLDFLGEASRFDARKLNSLFGDSEPVKNPKPDPRDWTLRDRLLIGEFVRRHHARLAHETAVHGVPGPGSPPLRLQGIEPDFADLAGIVARSHGMPIRDALPHLKEYDVREYKGIHPPFLMALARVADYLQVQSERAPTGMLRVRQLRSPISQREWKAHAAIRDIRNTHDDPEAIFIDAAPEDVRTFLRLRQLLAGIQGELDASWAVLGEIYGRVKGLDQLGLNLRRVRSSIDDVAEFAKTLPYLPYKAAFDAEGPELLKLLIKPLYGEHPEIGIRELLQNAVDACRELRDYINRNADRAVPELTEQGADVEILFEDKGKAGRWLEVSDRGIGMSGETVRGYFLKAGASFRRSDAWRKLHETSEGKSRVLRSGRFGIGVLAAFLLGDEVEVSTRNVTTGPDGGITFNATLDTEEIELRRCSRPGGTTIRVRIDEEATWNSLSKKSAATWNHETGQYETAGTQAWDWYCLADPKVARTIRLTKHSEQLAQEYSLPGPKAKLGPKWRRIKHEDYADIHWSYWDGPFLACNGIVIMKRDPSRYSRSVLRASDGYEVAWPNVSVFDPDGHLPLVLQRNSLATDKYPFQDELFADIIKDMLAYLLVRGPTHSLNVSTEGYRESYPGVHLSPLQIRPSGHFCSAANGLYLSDEWHMKQGGFHRFLLLGGLANYGENDPQLPAANGGQILLVPVQNPGGNQRYRDWIRFALCGATYGAFGYLRDFAVKCRRMLLSRSEYDTIRKGRVISKYWWSEVTEESSNEEWVVARVGNCDCKQTVDLLEFAKLLDAQAYWPILIEWHLSDSQSEPKALTPLARLWRELSLKSPVIPYDPGERRKNLPEAFDQLGEYIAAQNQLVADEEKAKKAKKKQPSVQPSDDESDATDP